jgi:acyl carrier protein
MEATTTRRSQMPATETVTNQEIKDLLHNMLVEEFDIEPELITDEATLEDLDLDSLDLVEIGQVIEQKYGVRIKASDGEGVNNLGDVIEMIHKRVVAGPSADDEAGDGAESDAETKVAD